MRRDDDVPGAPASRAPGSGTERVVALALAVMAAVLAVVYADLAKARPDDGAPPFDFINPLLSVQPGECVEVASGSAPGPASWLVVRAPGVVLRPYSANLKVAGWISPQHPDPKSFPPFLVCDVKPAPMGKPPAGSKSPDALPPRRDDPLVFPLNGFGLPLEAMGVLRDMAPTTVSWSGQNRRAYAVGLVRYGHVDGPWIIYMAQGVQALGTMERRYFRGKGELEKQIFRVPETCR